MMGPPNRRPSLILEFGGELVRRLKYPAIAVLAVLALGTLGYFLLGRGEWSWLNAFYMTSITLTTIGYGEILELDRAGRSYTLVLMWAGYGVILYATATVTAYFVEKNPARLIRERLMEQRIEELTNHFIVCGGDETSLHILREMQATRRPCVVVTNDPDRLAGLGDTVSILRGDPTDESVLRRAGLQRAHGVFASMGDDSKNMLITVLARFENPGIKIVAECRDNSLASKFERAGANYVVNPMYIGAMRMASEMVRPQVVTFLDRMLREQSTTRVEQVMIGSMCNLAGKTLAQAAIYEHSGLTPIALEKSDGTVIFNPGPDEVLTTKMALIVIGSPDQIARLSAYCA